MVLALIISHESGSDQIPQILQILVSTRDSTSFHLEIVTFKPGEMGGILEILFDGISFLKFEFSKILIVNFSFSLTTPIFKLTVHDIASKMQVIEREGKWKEKLKFLIHIFSFNSQSRNLIYI